MVKLATPKPSIVERLRTKQRYERSIGNRKNKVIVRTFPKNKGEYNGSCNRSDCLKSGATWYNHSTRKYYCASCANWLNTDKFNKQDAMELYGHDLCTEGLYIQIPEIEDVIKIHYD